MPSRKRWPRPDRALLVPALLLGLVGACAGEPVDAAAIASGIKARAKLPMQVDEETRLDEIRAISRTELGYFLTLVRTTRAQAESGRVGPQLEARLRAGACKNPDYLKFFRAGVSLRMTYQSQDRAEVARVILVPSDCPGK